jgi:hypothetical protein
MKRLSVAVLCGLLSSFAHAETTLRDFSSVLGQVSRMVGGNSSSTTNSSQFVASGVRVRLDDGRVGSIYGFECAPHEAKPCGSIRVDNGSHRVMVVPLGGKPFEERWTFRRLAGNQLVFVRPKGQFVTAAQ